MLPGRQPLQLGRAMLLVRLQLRRLRWGRVPARWLRVLFVERVLFVQLPQRRVRWGAVRARRGAVQGILAVLLGKLRELLVQRRFLPSRRLCVLCCVRLLLEELPERYVPVVLQGERRALQHGGRVLRAEVRRWHLQRLSSLQEERRRVRGLERVLLVHLLPAQVRARLFPELGVLRRALGLLLQELRQHHLPALAPVRASSPPPR